MCSPGLKTSMRHKYLLTRLKYGPSADMRGFFANLKIRHKLMLLLALPLSGLFFFSISQLNQSYTEWKDMKDVQKMTELAIKISALVQDIQLERGMAAGFLSSNGNDFGSA